MSVDESDFKLKNLINAFSSPAFPTSGITAATVSSKTEPQLVEAFQLNDPIPPTYNELINELIRRKMEPNIVRSIAILLMQYHILLIYQSSKALNGILEEKESSEKFISKLFPIIEAFSTVLDMPTYDFITIMKPIYEFLINSLINEKYFPNRDFGSTFNTNVLKATLEFILMTNEFSVQNHAYLFEYIKQYIRYFGAINQESIWKRNALENCKLIYEHLICIDDEKFSQIPINFFEGMLIFSSAILGYALESIPDNYSKQDVFDTFFASISFFGHTRHREDIESFICRSPRIAVIAKFIIWTTKNFPFFDGDFTQKFGVEEAEYFDKREIENIQDGVIIEGEVPNTKEMENHYLMLIKEIDKRQKTLPKGNCSKLIDCIQNFAYCCNSIEAFINIITTLFASLDPETFVIGKDADAKKIAISSIYIILRLLGLIEPTNVFDILEKSQALPKIIDEFLFFIDLIVLDVPAKEKEFLDGVRISLFSLLKFVYLDDPDSRDAINQCIFSLINKKRLGSIEYLLAFVTVIYRCDKNVALSFTTNTVFIRNFSNFLMKLDISGKYKKEVSGILNISFMFLTNFIDPKSKSASFSMSKEFCTMLRIFLFNAQTEDAAIVLITNILISRYDTTNANTKPGPFDAIIESLIKFFDILIENREKEKYFAIFTKTLSGFLPALIDNRVLFFEASKDTQFFNKLAELIQGNDKKETLQRSKLIITFFGQIMSQFQPMRSFLSKQPMKIAIDIIKENIKENAEIVTLLLKQVFEKDVSVFNSQTHYEIANAQILPYIHELTEGTQDHLTLFKFICRICKPSITNKLQVYQSKMIHTILNYIVSFKGSDEIPQIQQSCIYTLLDLFAIVSSLGTKCITMHETLSSMKIHKKMYRMWWTDLFISTFTKIFQSTMQLQVKSFFRCQEKANGFTLPTFNTQILGKSFTIITRFQISDNTKEKQQNLLSIIADNVKLFVLLENGFLNVSLIDNQLTKYNSKYEIQENKWYLLTFSTEGNSIKIHVNEKKVINRSCNFKPMNKVNISAFKGVSGTFNAFYLFNQAFDDQTVSLFSSLPTDFSSPLTNEVLKEMPSLPHELFTEVIRKSTIACYNARMTIGNKCQNMGSTIIGAAEADCQVIPSLYSFPDVILHTGGAKIFLPLFEQVNLPIQGITSDTSASFLFCLLTYFTSMLQNPDLADEFVSSNGFLCMASLLREIKPQYMTKQNMQQLIEIYYVLSDDNKANMMKTIFLSTPIWHAYSQDECEVVIYFIISEIKTNFKSFKKAASIGILLAIAASEEDTEIRNGIWLMITEYAKHKFTEEDADDIFAAADSSVDQLYKIETYQCIYAIIARNPELSKTTFKQYSKLLGLFQDTDDIISLIGMKLLAIISKSQGEGSIEKILCTLIQRGANTNFTANIIPEIIAEVNESKCINIAYIFIALTTYMNKEIILSFASELSKIQNIGKMLMQLPSWYIWLTNLLFNVEEEVDLNSPDLMPIANLYGSVLAGLVSEANIQAVSDLIGLFTYIQINFNLDTAIFLRRVYNIMFQQLSSKPTSQQQKIVSTEVMSFLFFIPSTECYCTNIQLYNKVSTSQTKTKMKLAGMIRSNAEVKTPAFQYSARINERGEWQDLEVAVWLIQYYILPSFRSSSTIWFTEAQFLISDICAFLAGFIARSSPERIYWTVTTMINVMEMAPNESSFYIYSNELIHSIAKNQKYFNQIPRFFSKCSRFYTKSFHYQSLEEIFSNVTFLESCAKYSVPFLESFCSLTEGNRFDRIYKKRNSRIVKFINYFNSDFTVLVKQNPERDARAELFTRTVTRLPIHCDKELRSLKSIMLRNGGPWSSQASGEKIHWKISMTYDKQFRRMLMKPNFNFDSHTTSLTKTSSLTFPEERDTQKSDIMLSTEATLITIPKVYSGVFSITSNCEIFFDDSRSKYISFKAEDIEMILRKFHLHDDRGLEFYLMKRKSFLFVFNTKEKRKSVLKFLKSKTQMPHLTVFQGDNSYEETFKQQRYTISWMNGEISNFEYLMYINIFAGRSFNDITQYPVFPWVLSDYTSDEINLNDTNSFRDLSKPITSINEEKLKKFLEKCCDDECKEQRFFYSHQFAVAHFLVRTEPFTTVHVNIQNGFDNPNRAFRNIKDEWEHVNNLESYNVELIPEFYYLPDFLYNKENYDVGGDVVLPKWAKNQENFIQVMKEALESEYVSLHINDWIDLIFGYKQKGENAMKANNLYLKNFYLDSPITDEFSAVFAETSGTTPYQLFTKPHPKRTHIPYVPTYKVQETISPKEITRFKLPAIFIAPYNDSVLYILSNLSVNVGTKTIGSIEYRGRPQFVVYKDTLVVMTDLNNRVKFYKISDNLKHIYTLSFSAALTSMMSSGGSVAVISLRDSSINIVDISSFSVIASFTPHFTTLSYLSSSPDAALIGSIDKTHKVIISNLYSGKLLYYFDADSPEYEKIIMLTTGLVLLQKTCSFSLFKNDGTLLNTFDAGSNILHVLCGDMPSGIEFICINTIQGKLTILSVPGLEVICSSDFSVPISSMTFIRESCTFVVSEATGGVFSFQLL